MRQIEKCDESGRRSSRSGAGFASRRRYEPLNDEIRRLVDFSDFAGGNPLQVQLFPDPEPEPDQLFVRLQEVDGAIGGALNDVVDEQL